MPNYDYKCPACSTIREINHPMNAAGEKPVCEKCGTRLERVFGQIFFTKNSPARPAAAETGSFAATSHCSSCAGGSCSTC